LDWSGVGLGVSLGASGTATVKCSQFNNNSQYAIVADGPGTLTSDSNTFTGTGNSLQNGASIVELNSGCGGGGEEGGERGGGEEGGERGFKPQNNLLPQTIAAAAPITAELTPLAETDMPGALADGQTFIAIVSVKLMQSGVEVGSAPGGAQASFDIPAGDAGPFTVWMWDGTKWVQVTSTLVGGKVVFSVTGPGIFVLTK
jgi:hypothetical protein